MKHRQDLLERVPLFAGISAAGIDIRAAILETVGQRLRALDGESAI